MADIDIELTVGALGRVSGHRVAVGRHRATLGAFGLSSGGCRRPRAGNWMASEALGRHRASVGAFGSSSGRHQVGVGALGSVSGRYRSLRVGVGSVSEPS